MRVLRHRRFAPRARTESSGTAPSYPGAARVRFGAAAVFTAVLLAAGFPAPGSAWAKSPDAGSDDPVSCIEIDLRPRDAMSRLFGLELDYLELRPGFRATVVGWPGVADELDEVGACYTVTTWDLGGDAARRARDDAPASGMLGAALGGAWNVPPFGSGSMAGYWTLDEVYALLDSLAANDVHGLLTAVDTIGVSLQGRPVLALGLVNESHPPGTRPEVLFTALTHAREPEGMQVILHFLLAILDGYGADPVLTWLADHREIWFVPVVNPDGYVRNENTYTGTGSFGFWRKNLRDNNSDGMITTEDGVDVNRNFGFAWGYDNAGSSPTPSSPTYRGTAAFSEPESQVLRDFCAAHAFRVANNYHTYFEATIYPWGHIPADTPDSAAYVGLGDEVTRLTGYAYGYGEEVLYPVNGDSDDWMYGDQVTKPKIFALTSEVGRLDEGFWPPPSRITPLAVQNHDSNVALAYGADVFLRADSLRVLTPSGFLAPGSLMPVTFRAVHRGVAGTTAGGIHAEVTSTDPLLTVVDGACEFADLGPGESAWPSGGGLLLTVDPSLPPGAEVALPVTFTDGGDFFGTDTLVVRVGEPSVLFSDDASQGLVGWFSTGGWDVESVGGNPAFSDSPYTDYNNNTDARLTLGAPLDLGGATAAVVRFQARWAIEGGYDFATVEASADSGSTWTPLAGTHTVPGHDYSGSAQLTGLPGYENTRRIWTGEEADLAPFLGFPDVRLRFRMRSDGGLTMSGWLVDDIAVLAYGPPALLAAENGASPPALWLKPPAPNPFIDRTEIVYSVPVASTVQVVVYNAAGRRVRVLSDGYAGAGEQTVQWDGLDGTGRRVPAGSYFVRVDTPGGTTSGKIQVLRRR